MFYSSYNYHNNRKLSRQSLHEEGEDELEEDDDVYEITFSNGFLGINVERKVKEDGVKVRYILE
jgi:hypothetical protein